MFNNYKRISLHHVERERENEEAADHCSPGIQSIVFSVSPTEFQDQRTESVEMIEYDLRRAYRDIPEENRQILTHDSQTRIEIIFLVT